MTFPMTSSSTQQARGIPGRVFVFLFVPVLLVLGGLTFSMAVRFQAIMGCLEQSRSLWPNASQELRARYDRFSRVLPELTNSVSIQKEIASLRNQFDSSSQFDRQSVVALHFEKSIELVTNQVDWDHADFQQQATQKMIVADRKRKLAQSGMIGWFTIQGLRLKLPPVFEPPFINH